MDADSLPSGYLNLFSKTSTFVSIDVVNSTGMKAGQNEQDVLYTFLAYHRLAAQLAYDCHGEVISITGDGIMCRFQRAEDAVSLVESVLAELPAFNKKSNRLSQPITLRMGVHTGEVLESQDLSSGQIISQTIDKAAKLQQGATPNTARLSEATASLVRERAAQFRRLGWDAGLQTNVYVFAGSAPMRLQHRQLPDPARVLAVEDELDEIVRLRRTLSTRRQEVFPVYNQNQAALCLNAWKPHVVLVSLDLPWQTGWELLVGLRSDATLASLPIIALSRQTSGETIQRSLKLGANGFLRKPLESGQILKRVDVVLREFYL